MKVVLWIVQTALAVLCLAGGAYKAGSPDVLARQFEALTAAGWRALGIFEIVCGVLLIAPTVSKRLRSVGSFAAGGLAIETLGLAAFYARYSLDLAPTNPLVWAVAMGLLAAFVAYGRRPTDAPARRAAAARS